LKEQFTSVKGYGLIITKSMSMNTIGLRKKMIN